MFLPDLPDGPLEQGDICAPMQLPVVTKELKVQTKRGSVALLTPEELEAGVTVFVVEPVTAPVIVLSQSCDLLDAESDENKRIVVAPLVSENESVMLAESRETFMKGADLEVLAKALKFQNAENPPKDVTGLATRAEKLRLDILSKVWKGDAIGVFPVKGIDGAGGSSLIPRSLVHFDFALSLPRALWLEHIKKKRVSRLTSEWRGVLQESLREWLGRFAFPGTLEERVRVGLAKDFDRQK